VADADVRARLLDAWTDEVQATIVYELIAARESDPRRADVLRALAEIETSHRSRLEARMLELDIAIPDERTVGLSAWRRLQVRLAPVERLLAQQEAMEQEIAAQIDEQPTGDEGTDRLLEQIRDEERQHTVALGQLRTGAVPVVERAVSVEGPQVRLTRILGRERWHRNSGGWISGSEHRFFRETMTITSKTIAIAAANRVLRSTGSCSWRFVAKSCKVRILEDHSTDLLRSKARSAR